MSFEDPVIGYASPDGYQRAERLVRLAGIFNVILAVLDMLAALVLVVIIVLLGNAVVPESVFYENSGFAAGGGPPPLPALLAVLGVEAALAVGVAVVKLIGGNKLLRTSRHAWGWGLAAGIVGCTQFWCSVACIVPLAGGIYTIWILCRQDVRRYLREEAAAEQVVGHG